MAILIGDMTAMYLPLGESCSAANSGFLKNCSTGMSPAFANVAWAKRNNKKVRAIRVVMRIITSVFREFNIHDEGITPLAFDYDNKTMFVASNIDRDRLAVYRYDPETDQLGEMLFGPDEVNVTGLIMSDKRKKLLGVAYFTDYPERKYFDPAEAAVMKSLKALFPDRRVAIVSASKDETLNILRVYDDQDPGRYYLFDRKTNKMKYLVASKDWFNHVADEANQVYQSRRADHSRLSHRSQGLRWEEPAADRQSPRRTFRRQRPLGI